MRRADVVAAHHQPESGEEKGEEGEDVRSSGPPLALIKGDDAGEGEGGGGGGGGGGGRVQEDCYASISISHDGDYATAVCLGLAP